MNKRARSHWIIWGYADKNEILGTLTSDLTESLTQAFERMPEAHDDGGRADAHDEKEALETAPEYQYYPTGDPWEEGREEARQLAMIHERDPDWVPLTPQSWSYVITDSTEDQVRAKAASLSGVRGFLRVD